MESKLFNLIGYHLEVVDLVRAPHANFFKRIYISIDDIECNIENIVSFVVEFSLYNEIENIEDSFGSVVRFRTAFELNNILYDIVNDKTEETSDLTRNDVLASLVTFVFPYMRQQIFSMTNDSAGEINLPLIDARLIVEGIELLLNEETE